MAMRRWWLQRHQTDAVAYIDAFVCRPGLATHAKKAMQNRALCMRLCMRADSALPPLLCSVWSSPVPQAQQHRGRFDYI